MNIKINIIEVSYYLAEDMLRRHFCQVVQIDNNEGGYTEEAQELFDELYDEYYNTLDEFKIID